MHAPTRAFPRPVAPPPAPSATLPLSRPPTLSITLALALAAALALPARAADWPGFLGPNHNGSTPETPSLPWPREGPPVRWSRPVGAGFAGPAAAGNRLFLFQRVDNQEVLECLDTTHTTSQAPAVVWKHSAPATYQDDFGFDDGPRATPTVTASHVVTAGAAGHVTCLDRASGRALWTVDTARQFGARKGFFGFASAPLVAGPRVIVQAGGTSGHGIVALSLADGSLLWKATDDEAGYASPIPLPGPGPGRAAAEPPEAACLTREALVILDLADGRVRARFPFRSRQHASVNAASPLLVEPGGQLFLSASYQTGATLVRREADRLVPVWSGDDRLSSHYASVVLHRGVIFGFHGRQETGTALRAVDAATGKVLWSQEGLGAGTVTLAGDQLLVLSERGELIAAPASGSGFKATSRAQVLGSSTRAFPALAGGRLYARDPRRLVCLQVGPEPNPASAPAPRPTPAP